MSKLSHGPRRPTATIAMIGIPFAFAPVPTIMANLRRLAKKKEPAMLRGIYNVASAMELAARNQETVSQNIVNAATPGYRRQGSVFDATSGVASHPRRPHANHREAAARSIMLKWARCRRQTIRSTSPCPATPFSPSMGPTARFTRATAASNWARTDNSHSRQAVIRSAARRRTHHRA